MRSQLHRRLGIIMTGTHQIDIITIQAKDVIIKGITWHLTAGCAAMTVLSAEHDQVHAATMVGLCIIIDSPFTKVLISSCRVAGQNA